MEAFLEGRWKDTQRHLKYLANDGPSEFLLHYIKQHPDGPPADWNGVVKMESKMRARAGGRRALHDPTTRHHVVRRDGPGPASEPALRRGCFPNGPSRRHRPTSSPTAPVGAGSPALCRVPLVRTRRAATTATIRTTSPAASTASGVAATPTPAPTPSWEARARRHRPSLGDGNGDAAHGPRLAWRVTLPWRGLTARRRAAGPHRKEGVSCESCHGPAEKWLTRIIHGRPGAVLRPRKGTGRISSDPGPRLSSRTLCGMPRRPAGPGGRSRFDRRRPPAADVRVHGLPRIAASPLAGNKLRKGLCRAGLGDRPGVGRGKRRWSCSNPALDPPIGRRVFSRSSPITIVSPATTTSGRPGWRQERGHGGGKPALPSWGTWPLADESPSCRAGRPRHRTIAAPADAINGLTRTMLQTRPSSHGRKRIGRRPSAAG